MKVVHTLWGLLVDDARLASILMIALIVAAAISYLGHWRFLAAVVIWLGLILSLGVSVEHQLNLKMESKGRSK